MSKLPTKSELWIIKKFLLNAVNCIGSESISDNHDLITWILSNQDQLQLPKTLQLCEKQIHAATKDENRRSARGFGRSNNKALMDIWKDWHTKFARHVNYTKSSGANKLQVSAEFIGKICDLESYEVDIIIFIALAEKFKIVKSLSYAVEDSLRSFDNAKKGVCEESIHRILAAENLPLSELNTDKLKVAKYGIVEERYSRIYLSHNTRKIFQSEVDDEEKLKELILGKANSANLEIDEFNYLGGNVEILTKLLKAHSEKSQKPLNIFLYGSPGTGKTEFAKTLGRAANREVYFIGEQDENNEDPSRADRISALML
ncbi:MAG: ATP-binding protein, partial [Caulobacterales bacterium]|nr:ATP-binding protein [Caulobacterales bacterium]